MGKALRHAGVALMLAIACGAWAAPVADLDARVHRLAEQLRCLVCQNQTLADSDADLAVALRAQIREQLRHGASEQAVKNYLVGRYGDFVLYEPPMRPETWLLWFGPFLLVGGSVGWWWHRRRRPAMAGASRGGTEAMAAATPTTSTTPATPATPTTVPIPASASRLGTWIIAVSLGTIPLAAMLIYLHLGRPEMTVAAWRDTTVAAGDASHPVDATQIEAMVARLAMRLRDAPDDAGGWYMLARSYGALERFDDAAAAYARAVALVPDAAALRADYADALASASGGSLEGAPLAQVTHALALDPDEPKALALAGTAAAERGDLRAAVGYWQRLYRLLPADSETAKRVAANLAAAREHVR